VIFTFLIVTSQLVLSTSANEKKEAPKATIELSQAELKSYIELTIRHHEAYKESCTLEQYWDNEFCKPCNQICGVEINQRCQLRCPGYIRQNYQRKNDDKNNEQDDKIFLNTMLIVGGFILLALVAILQVFMFCRMQKMNGKSKEKEVFETNESRMTDLTGSRDSNRENTRPERIPLVQNQGCENNQLVNEMQIPATTQEPASFNRQDSESTFADRSTERNRFNQVPASDHNC